jgi:hypothetical protein
MDSDNKDNGKIDWLMAAGGAIAGAAATWAVMEFFRKRSSTLVIPSCPPTMVPNTFNVVLHGMMVIGVYDNGVRLAMPSIMGHRPLWGFLEDGQLRPISPGRYTIQVTPDPKAGSAPFYENLDVLFAASEVLSFQPGPPGTKSSSPAMITIDLKFPADYKGFRYVSRTFTGQSAKDFNIHPAAFPMGHVLRYQLTAGSPGNVLDDNGHVVFPIPSSGNALRNLHIYHENPCGAHHMHHLSELNSLFKSDSPVDLDIVDADALPSNPGCDLTAFGISALDECDLVDLRGQNISYPGKPDFCPVTSADPATCLSYVFYDAEDPLPPAIAGHKK